MAQELYMRRGHSVITSYSIHYTKLYEADLAEDKNLWRAQLIGDCHVAYVVSIGGPAAAKVIRADIYPIKVPDGGPADNNFV